MFARILIPIDGSDCSKQAIASGLELAKRLDAEVIFLHVLENPLTAAYPTPVTISYYSEIYDELKEAAQELL